MKNKIMGRDYKDELADIAEKKGFTQEAENLLLSMLYKVEDSYENYKTVKREVPEREVFLREIVDNVSMHCQEIVIAAPRTYAEKELQENKCKIMTEDDAKTKLKRVISYPNEKTLLYGLQKVSLPPLAEDAPIEVKALTTAIHIGKCIAYSEAIRDFNGWTWSIDSDEVESTECNVIYTFLSYLLGYNILSNIQISKIKKVVGLDFFEELKRVAIQFYVSYDNEEHEKTLKKIAENKTKLEKMKNQSEYIFEITEIKKQKLSQIKAIDEALGDSKILMKQYTEYNAKLPNERKVFSVSHYEDMLQRRRQELLGEMQKLNKQQNPSEFFKERDEIQYELKLYEEKTDIIKLQREFLNAFTQMIDKAIEKKDIVDLIYKIRYLNFLPNCKMDLNEVEQKIIPKAIDNGILEPISNNNSLDYKLLKGIFESQAIILENLYIKLKSTNNIINVELYDGEILESTYDVILPEGSSIEIKRSKKMKIFE